MVATMGGLGKLDLGPLIVVQLTSVTNSKEVPAQCIWAPVLLNTNSVLFAGSQAHILTLNGRLPCETLDYLGSLCDLDLNATMALFNAWTSLAVTSKHRFVDFLVQFAALAPLLSGVLSDGGFSFDWAKRTSAGPYEEGPTEEVPSRQYTMYILSDLRPCGSRCALTTCLY